MRKQPFFDHLSDDNHVAGKVDIFVVQIAAITERVSIRREKAPICPDDGEARRRLDAVVDRLPFELTAKALEANLVRVSLH